MDKKKGMFFSLDALIAVIIIFLTLLIIFPVLKYQSYETEIPADIMTTLSNLKIGEINNSYVQSLILQGNITDLNKSVLEQIGEFYVTDINTAKSLANSIFSYLNVSDNIGIWYGTTLIVSKNSTPYEASKDVEIERQVISGIQNGSSVTGFSARAFLSSNMPKEYYYFGGYVGDGNISIEIDYGEGIEDVEIEITVNKDFDIYINDIFSGHYENSSSVFEPINYSLGAYVSNFQEGTNTFKIVGEDLYTAGGFIKVIYKNFSVYEQPSRYYFPGIEGIINLYDGFYIPNTIEEMKIVLHYESNSTIFLNIGNITVFNGSSDGEITEIIDNSELSSLLNYNDISMKTVPLRLGLYEVEYIGTGSGNVDVVLITDLSGSMNWKLDSEGNGVERDCDDPNLYDSDTKRISLAKCLDKMVVDIILNNSGNRIALSGFYSDVSNPYKGRVYEESLTNDSDYLKNKIEEYSPQGGTPICAAINDAYKILNEESNSSRNRFVIVMSDGIPTHTCQAASGCEGTRTGLQGEEALWLGWGAGCWGGFDDCEVNDCECASQNANWSSCRVYKELNATVYSVGFGPVGSCSMANNTLRNIADCGGGKYYSSNNATILEEFYRSIAQEILQISYEEQRAKIIGELSTKLYSDSYIEFNYTKGEVPYGLVITDEKLFYDSYYGNFSIPFNSSIVETRAISYSGPRWTDNVEINGNSIYKLSNYGVEYLQLGDPYAINIPNSLVEGDYAVNNVKISTGLAPDNSTEGSLANKIIYTTIRDIVSYSSSISAYAVGCKWHIDFEDGSNISVNIPTNYSGTNSCYYQEVIRDYDNNDAIQSAVYSLLESLDFDSDGKLNVKFTEQDFEISSSEITGIPYSWSTEVQIRRWV